MKILCIMGGPKKHGNTLEIVKKVVAEISKDITIGVEYLFLADQNITPCQGCFSCIANGLETCTNKEDIALILAKMLDSDGLILAAPTYTANVPALTKLFFDRLCYLYHRPVFFGKPAIVVSTVGFYGVKGALRQLRSISGWGYRVVDELGVVPAQYNLKYIPKIEKRIGRSITRTAKRFSDALRRPKALKLSLTQYLIFQALKASVTSARSLAKADYAYYGEREYYYDVKIPLFLKIIGAGVRKLVTVEMKKRYQSI